MSREFAAPAPREQQVPAYTVVVNDKPIEKAVSRFDEKTRTIVKETVILEGGYMVYFARGHSAFYESLEALEKAGLGDVVPLINSSLNQEAEVNKDMQEFQPATQRVIQSSKQKG